MKIEEIAEIYALISESQGNLDSHDASISLRKIAFQNLTSGLVKIAFDTRRIDQETSYIPRRGLQNYNRSQEFITNATAEKLTCLKNLRDVLVKIKQQYGRERAWLDSYCRVLLDTINRALRTEQKDGDYSDNQPGVGSVDYIEEMLFVRYRIVLSNLSSMTEEEVRNILLSKDPELEHGEWMDMEEATPRIQKPAFVSKADVVRETSDALIERLFGGVKATDENPEVERTVTITIKDKRVE